MNQDYSTDSKMRIYFDNAATTPLDTAVLEVMLPYLQGNFGNASATHYFGSIAKNAIENSRRRVANCWNVRPSEIFFTASGTEANNWAIFGSVQGLNIQHAITSPIEHVALLKPLRVLAQQKMIQLHYVLVDRQGGLCLTSLRQLLKKYPGALVCFTHANSELGNLNDIYQIADICQQFQGYCLIDAVQTAGYYPLCLSQLPIHCLTASAHKLHGPKGVGCLYIAENFLTCVRPWLYGGAQEQNMRAGTESVAHIVGMAEALSRAVEAQGAIRKHLQMLKNRMMVGLKSNVPGVLFNGQSGDFDCSIDKILHIAIPGVADQHMLLFYLDIQGVAVSAGSACASGTTQLSHVWSYVDIPKGYGVLRISFGKQNTLAEVDAMLKILYEKAGNTLIV